jgi:hypothetical protein
MESCAMIGIILKENVWSNGRRIAVGGVKIKTSK